MPTSTRPFHKTLIWQIAIVACLTLIGKFGAFGKDVLLSYIFGAGSQTDAYFVANAIPGLVFAGFFATIGLVFLPIYTRAGLQSENSVQAVVHTGVGLYMTVSASLTALTLLFADVMVGLVAPKAPPDVLALAGFLTRILSLGFVFSGWVGLHNAILQANRVFIWPMTVPIINHAFVIVGLLLAWRYNGSVVPVVGFALAGWVVQAPLAWWRARRIYRIRPFNCFSRSRVWQLVMLSVPVFFSVSLDQLNTLIDFYLSSQFGNGAISYLSYASRLMLLLAGLFSLLVSYFVFPYLAKSLADESFTSTRKHLTRAFVLMLFFTVPLSLFCLIKSEEIIAIVFGRGDFGNDDIVRTAGALRFYAAGMIFIGAREIFNRVFLADQRALALFFLGLVAAVMNVSASLFFIPMFGLSGIALGTSCGALVYVTLQVGLMVIRYRNILSPLLLLSVGMAAVSGAAMTWSLQTGLLEFDSLTGPLGLLLTMTANGLFYLAIFALLFSATIPVLGKRAW